MGGGAGFGFVKDGLQRMAQNRNLLKKKSVYKDIVNSGSSKKSIYQYKEATPEMLEAIRTYKQAELLRNRRKSLIIGEACLALVVIAFWIIFA